MLAKRFGHFSGSTNKFFFAEKSLSKKGLHPQILHRTPHNKTSEGVVYLGVADVAHRVLLLPSTKSRPKTTTATRKNTRAIYFLSSRVSRSVPRTRPFTGGEGVYLYKYGGQLWRASIGSGRLLDPTPRRICARKVPADVGAQQDEARFVHGEFGDQGAARRVARVGPKCARCAWRF